MSQAKQILICITQVLCIACFAQTHTIDSLKKILPLLEDTARINCLNELGSEFSDRYWSKSKYQQTDTALYYTLQAQNESQQLHYLRGIGKALLNMGLIEEEHGNLKTAEDYTQKALTILQKENMQAEYHRGRVFLGWILHNRGCFAQSIKIYKTELPYYEAIKDTESFAKIYRVTARAYDMLGNSEIAFTYFQKDFILKKKPEDAWGKRSTATLKASVYLAAGDTANAVFYYKQAALLSTDQHAQLGAYHFNKAIAYNLQKKYDSALLEIRENITYIQSSTSDSLYRKVALMGNYGYIISLFLPLKKADSVFIYSQQVLPFFRHGEDIINLMHALKNVAYAYNLKKENSKALSYANQLLAYAQTTGARRFLRDAYELLWHNYSDEHKANLAHSYQLKYILLNDSLQNDKYISQAAAWQAINEINIKEVNYANQLKINEERSKAKIKFLDREKKTQLSVFISAIALISLFTIVFVRNNRLKIKKDQLQQLIAEANAQLEHQRKEQQVSELQKDKTELEMQALRAQMNPHFIFNSLNSINRFILQNNRAQASEYLTKFSKLVRMILQNSQASLITLESELESLQLYLEMEALRFNYHFDYKISVPDDLDISVLKVPPLIIQPFAENAIWHGLMHKEEKGQLDIEVSQENNYLFFKITDDGIGRSQAAELASKSATKHKSMGLRITADRIAMMQNTNGMESPVTINDLVNADGSAAGTEVIIKIPVMYD